MLVDGGRRTLPESSVPSIRWTDTGPFGRSKKDSASSERLPQPRKQLSHLLSTCKRLRHTMPVSGKNMSVSRRAREKNKSARALLVVLASASTAAALTTSPIAIYPTRPTHAARAPVPTPARPRTSVPAVTPPAPPRTRSSRRAHLAADLGAVAAAVGARGLVDVARDLVARRPNDERVLHRFTEHLKEGFNADPVLTTASYDVASRIKTVRSPRGSFTENILRSSTPRPRPRPFKSGRGAAAGHPRPKLSVFVFAADSNGGDVAASGPPIETPPIRTEGDLQTKTRKPGSKRPPRSHRSGPSTASSASSARTASTIYATSPR